MVRRMVLGAPAGGAGDVPLELVHFLGHLPVVPLAPQDVEEAPRIGVAREAHLQTRRGQLEQRRLRQPGFGDLDAPQDGEIEIVAEPDPPLAEPTPMHVGDVVRAGRDENQVVILERGSPGAHGLEHEEAGHQHVAVDADADGVPRHAIAVGVGSRMVSAFPSTSRSASSAPWRNESSWFEISYFQAPNLPRLKIPVPPDDSSENWLCRMAW